MSAVTVQEIVEALRQADDCRVIPYFKPLANRIEAHGIAPPDGMVLVPKEPTQAMLTAADGVDFKNEDTVGTFYNYWHVMLAAAPEAKP